LLGLLATIVPLAVPALTTDADDIVAELELRGYFIERGADVDFAELERLAEEWPDLYFVVLARDPSGGTDLLATETLSTLGVEATVIVVSPGEIGARSTTYSNADLDQAIDGAIDRFDTSYYDGFTDFANALASSAEATPVQATPGETASGSGGSGGLVFLPIIVVVGGLIWWAIHRSNRSREVIFQSRIDELKGEIQGQLSEAANDILELEDDIFLSDNEDAKELYYSGSAGCAQFQERLAGASSLAELDDLAEGADLALWQLESAAALLDGIAPPPRPSVSGPTLSHPCPHRGSGNAPNSPKSSRFEENNVIDGVRDPVSVRAAGWAGSEQQPSYFARFKRAARRRLARYPPPVPGGPKCQRAPSDAPARGRRHGALGPRQRGQPSRGVLAAVASSRHSAWSDGCVVR